MTGDVLDKTCATIENSVARNWVARKGYRVSRPIYQSTRPDVVLVFVDDNTNPAALKTASVSFDANEVELLPQADLDMQVRRRLESAVLDLESLE